MLLTGGTPGVWEIILILVVVLLLFGAKRLPELSRSLGKSLSEFKKGRAEGDKEAEQADADAVAGPESTGADDQDQKPS
jgi:sec-independent protein translocase protein TatA